MVRVLFNGTVLELTECEGQEAIDKGGLCSLDAFRKMADELDPKDYKKACEPRSKL